MRPHITPYPAELSASSCHTQSTKLTHVDTGKFQAIDRQGHEQRGDEHEDTDIIVQRGELKSQYSVCLIRKRRMRVHTANTPV